jgi:hypothetical protein
VLTQCYEQVNCFLLPSPGEKVCLLCFNKLLMHYMKIASQNMVALLFFLFYILNPGFRGSRLHWKHDRHKPEIQESDARFRSALAKCEFFALAINTLEACIAVSSSTFLDYPTPTRFFHVQSEALIVKAVAGAAVNCTTLLSMFKVGHTMLSGVHNNTFGGRPCRIMWQY